MVDTSLLSMKSSASAASPPARKRTPLSLKGRLHLRGVFSRKIKSPPLTLDEDDVDSNLKLSEHDDYGSNPAIEESSAQRRKSIGSPDPRGRRDSIFYHSNPTEEKQLVSLDTAAVPTMEDDRDDDDKALAKEIKKKEDSDSTLSTEEEDYNARDVVSRALQIETPGTITRKMRRKSLGVECIPRDALGITVIKKKHIRRASVGAIAATPQSRVEQASVANTAMNTPTMKKKTKVRRESEKIGSRKTQEELAGSTPKSVKKKAKKIRRASLGVVDTPHTLEDVSLADKKSSEKKKKIRSRSVGAAADAKSRRKSSKPESPQQVHHGTMELNDVEDESLMTPSTKGGLAVGFDGKVRCTDAHRKRLSDIKPPALDADTPVKSPSAHRKRLSAFKPPSPLNAETPGKSPGKLRKERVRSDKSKLDKHTSELSDITFSNISSDNLLNSQASEDHSPQNDHITINSENGLENPQVAHLHETISQLRAQVETFKVQHQAANVEASRSRKELNSVKLEYQKAQTERREVRTELQESEAIVQDKDRKIAALEKAVESQLDKVDELEEQLKKANDEIYQQQNKVLHLEAQILHADEGSRSNVRAEEKNIQLDEQRHARLEKRQHELDEQLHQIERERTHLEALRRDNNSRQSEEHSQEIESLKQIQAETAKKLSEKEESFQELQRKLEVAWQLNMDGLNSSMNTVKTGSDKQVTRKKLQEEKHQLSATLEKKDETIAYMQLELNRLKKGLVTSRSGNLASLAREADARKAQAQAAKSKYQGAQKRNTLLEDEIDHWKSLNCNLEDDVQAVKAEASEWKAKYEQMQAGMSDPGSPVYHSPFSTRSKKHPDGDLSDIRAIRRRASIGGVYNSDVGDGLAELPSSTMSGSASQRNSSTIRDSLREMCSTPIQHKNNDGSIREGSVREGSLRGVRSMLSSWVSPLPLANNSNHSRIANNSNHSRNSNHIPLPFVTNNSNHSRNSNHIPLPSIANNSNHSRNSNRIPRNTN